MSQSSVTNKQKTWNLYRWPKPIRIMTVTCSLK